MLRSSPNNTPMEHSAAAWEVQLIEYKKQHPEVRIFDTFDHIRPLLSRATMLAGIGKEGICLQARSTTFHVSPFKK